MRLLGAIGYCFHIIMKVRGSLIIADIRREFERALFSGEKRAVGEEGSLAFLWIVWVVNDWVTKSLSRCDDSSRVMEPRGGCVGDRFGDFSTLHLVSGIGGASPRPYEVTFSFCIGVVCWVAYYATPTDCVLSRFIVLDSSLDCMPRPTVCFHNGCINLIIIAEQR